MKKILLVAVIGLGTGAVAWGQRLPGSVAPETYDLKFEPDLEKATFTGEATIAVKLLKPTKSVTLNAAELEFHDASIAVAGAAQKAAVSLEAQKEQATRVLFEPERAPEIRGNAIRGDRCSPRFPVLR